MTGLRGQVSRRQFVATSMAGAAGAYVLADPLLGRAMAAVPLAGDVAFTTGVASGQVTQNAITLWTQVDGLAAPSRLGVEIARDAGFSNVIATTEALADPADGGTARVRVRGRFLKPGERYYYRFSGQNADSRVGRFRTAPPPDSQEPVKIAYFACQDYGTGFYTAHRDMAAQDVDLVIGLGDYMYENSFFLGDLRPLPKTPDGQVRTLEEYREQYRTYNRDADLQAVRAMAPMTVIWDDHEVEDNYAGDLPGGYYSDPGPNGEPPRTDQTAGPEFSFAQRKRNGYKAFFEVHPMIRNAVEPDRSYSRFRYGQVELFNLDTRQYRTDQPCNPGDDFIGFCSNQGHTADPNATLLGARQRNWLVNGLKRSTANWKLISNQVMMMALDIFPGNTMNTDAWDGYAAERAYICDQISQNKIKDVHFFTGDIHTFFAGRVTRTGREPWVPFADYQGGPPVATELVVGSISSQGISDRVAVTLIDLQMKIEQALNPNAVRPSQEALANGIAEVVDPLALGLNPHMIQANTAYKGYGLAEVSKDQMKVKFRATRDPKSPTSTAFTLASFTVPRGKAQIYRDATAAQRRKALPVDRSARPTQDQALKYITDFAAYH